MCVCVHQKSDKNIIVQVNAFHIKLKYTFISVQFYARQFYVVIFIFIGLPFLGGIWID